MKIGSPIFSQRYLNRTSRALQTSLERLTSGKRINSARDDAAGLSMSIGLDAQVRGAAVAIRNANDGMSMLNVAEGAMNEMTNLLQSMRELAVQAANGTLSSTERSGINDQVSGLIAEFDRIASETDFNGIKLLDGTFGTRALQVGTQKEGTLDVGLGDLRKESAFEKTVGTGTFQASVGFYRGEGVTSAMLADVNGDDILDLISTASQEDKIMVSIGNGDGTFKEGEACAVGGAPTFVKTTDFNNDGIADIVVTGWSDSTLNVLLGNGDGTFKPRVSYASGGDLYDLTLGDFNGDGAMDVATASNAADVINVFLGNGDGTLRAKSDLSIGATLYSIATADLNHDGILDLVAGTDFTTKVLLGNGDGTFKPGIDYMDISIEAMSVAAVDVNGDGIMDLIGGAANDKVAVALGNGDGTFRAASVYDGGSRVDVGDFNGDGIVDVCATSSGGEARVLIGNGDGSFKAGVGYGIDTDATGVTLGDLNGDGVLDVVVATNSSDNIDVLIGNAERVTAIADMDLTSQAAAAGALGIVDSALSKLAEERASVGNLQTRLESAVDYLYTSRETLSRAYGEIMDADIAQETAELVRQQILQQAGISVLAQANMMQARVLELLRW